MHFYSSQVGSVFESLLNLYISFFPLAYILGLFHRTFDYIVRELPKVPTHVPVCVLGNQRDMGEHRVILPDDTREFLCHLNR